SPARTPRGSSTMRIPVLMRTRKWGREIVQQYSGVFCRGRPHLFGGENTVHFANKVRGKNSQYSCSLNHAHLMSKSLSPGTRRVRAKAEIVSCAIGLLGLASGL